MHNLEKELTKIREVIIAGNSTAEEIANSVHPDYRESAKNLYNYLILRTFDLRKVHDSLSEFGISSMRSAESYVWQNINSSLRIIKLLQGKEFSEDDSIEGPGYKKAKRLLTRHANQLFDMHNNKFSTEIMVTMPTEISENLDLIRELLLAGTEIARINLSHDNEEVWQKMVRNLKTVSKALNIPVKIYMDLSGPKIRTAPIQIRGKKKLKDFIRIKKGEHLILTKNEMQGKNAVYDENGHLLSYAEVGITLPQIIDDLKVGDPVFFDDGMIESRVISKTVDDVELVITNAHKSKLKGGKGLNFPETHLNLPSLTEADVTNLPFVIKNADIVGYSFVRDQEDVRVLYQELEKLGDSDIGVIFKIENKEAFENLSLILFEGMKRRKIGVMIARGDLAVELGYEGMSEVQKQILWFCEAAHVPVVWATQVLENLAKTGIATRAEVSDVSLSAQAECVMLNKGPHIVEAVKLLKNILKRIEKHYSKKKPAMRALDVAKLKLAKLEETVF